MHPYKLEKGIISIFIPVIIVIVVAIAAIIYFSVGAKNSIDSTSNSSEDIKVIGISMGTLRTARWERDAELLKTSAEKLGASVSVLYANENSSLQITQVEDLINQGVSALIVVPYSSEESAEIVEKAHEADIPVIAYDRMILHEELDYYVSFDSVEVGRLQAEAVVSVVDQGKFAYIGGSEDDNNAFLLKEGSLSVLNPLVKSNDIDIVLETFTPGWRYEEAYKIIKEYLENGGELDAVVAANDGTAFGVIEALKEFDLDGKVPVSGQDAELTALRRIIDGTQTATVYKPISSLAQKAMEIAIDASKGHRVETNAKVSNGLNEIDSYLIDSVLVIEDNIEETVVADGFHSFEDIYGSSN